MTSLDQGDSSTESLVRGRLGPVRLIRPVLTGGIDGTVRGLGAEAAASQHASPRGVIYR
jgi:hypothetical protein